MSGSGKSSLVFGTIAAESQRLINETYTAFIQSFMPSLGRPDVDSLTNLSAAIIVDQERMGASSRSTVDIATDTYSMLRIIHSRFGDPHIGGSFAYGFNDPQGMCPECEGRGRVSTIDVDALVDRDLSLNEGAITFPNFNVGSWYWKIFAESCFFDVDKPLRDYTDAAWEQLLHGPESKVKLTEFTLTYEGLVDKFRSLYAVKDLDSMQPTLRAAVERVATSMQCPGCGTYVFDEPMIGLHPHDVQNMNDLLLRLRDKGNTVLVVEHEAEVIEIADRVVDIGPGAGQHGGQVVYEGDVAALRKTDTLTGRHLDRHQSVKTTSRTPTGAPAHRRRRSAQPAQRVGGHTAWGADRSHRRRRLG